MNEGVRAGFSESEFVSDLGSDAIGSLDLFERVIRNVDECPSDWKWCLLSAHSSLHSLLGSILSGADGSGIYNKQSQSRFREWIEWVHLTKFLHPVEFDLSSLHVASLRELYLRSKEKDLMNGVPLKASEEMDRRIDRLIRYRDNLVHHESTTWIIQKSDIAECLLAAIDVLDQLIAHKGIVRNIDLNRAAHDGALSRYTQSIRGHLENYLD
jgi:hypothetical protein